MNEEGWLAGGEAQPMLEFLRDKASDRKLRLLAVACCRRVWDGIRGETCRYAVEVTERFVEGEETEEERRRWHEQVWAIHTSLLFRLGPDHPSTAAAFATASASAHPQPWLAGYNLRTAAIMAARGAAALRHSQSEERAAQAALIRDIFENPFRPVTFSSAWRTDTAVSLARGMYGSRDFGAMPILADALQDAGCDSDDVLSHCRTPGEHVRGCWVVDLVLGLP